MSRRILLIEDSADIAALVDFHLADLGYTVMIESDGEIGLRRLANEPFDLLILDWMLPGKDGLDICRELRAQGSRVPILMLTARASEIDRVLGLEMGADDFMVKPFSIMDAVCAGKSISSPRRDG